MYHILSKLGAPFPRNYVLCTLKTMYHVLSKLCTRTLETMYPVLSKLYTPYSLTYVPVLLKLCNLYSRNEVARQVVKKVGKMQGVELTCDETYLIHCVLNCFKLGIENKKQNGSICLSHVVLHWKVKEITLNFKDCWDYPTCLSNFWWKYYMVLVCIIRYWARGFELGSMIQLQGSEGTGTWFRVYRVHTWFRKYWGKYTYTHRVRVLTLS